ncbi:MarC family protein [Catenulispora yoronensis]
MFDAKLFLEAYITLFVIMDPPGTLPIFLALTNGKSKAERTRAAWQAALVSFCVICVFALFGQQILDYLGVTLPALQAAGGLLLLLIALELLTGKSEEPSNANESVNVALVPLGTPLLAARARSSRSWCSPRAGTAHLAGIDAVALAIVAIHLTLWFTMRFSVPVIRVIKDSGVTLVTRIAGLLLSAIAVQMVADAVRAFVKAG